MNLQSAHLDLQRSSLGGEETMDWAIQLSQRETGIDNLHLKSGVCLADGIIVLVATGYKEGMPAQTGGLLMHFLVQQVGANRKLMLRET